MSSIVLFGGTFDPPHLGHLALCTLTRELLQPDKVILSVSRNPLKSGATASNQQRFEMVSLLVEELNETGNCFVASDWELKQNDPSYTLETLQYLATQYPNAKLLLAIGEDNYRIFSKWKSPDKILDMAELVVFSRQLQPNTPSLLPEFPNAKLHFIKLDLPISSTALRLELAHPERRRLAFRKMPSLIARYISTHNLYLNAEA
ncbi:MAG: nicotinate (nicotinamide) nucleotide adenylyltransferase [Candidatus Thermochlorobacter sp.]